MNFQILALVAISAALLHASPCAAAQTSYERPDEHVQASLTQRVNTLRTRYIQAVRVVEGKIIEVRRQMEKKSNDRGLLIVLSGLEAELENEAAAYANGLVLSLRVEVVRLNENLDAVSSETNPAHILQVRTRMKRNLDDIQKHLDLAEQRGNGDLGDKLRNASDYLKGRLREMEKEALVLEEVAVALREKIAEFDRRILDLEAIRSIHRSMRDAKAAGALQEGKSLELEQMFREMEATMDLTIVDTLKSVK